MHVAHSLWHLHATVQITSRKGLVNKPAKNGAKSLPSPPDKIIIQPSVVSIPFSASNPLRVSFPSTPDGGRKNAAAPEIHTLLLREIICGRRPKCFFLHRNAPSQSSAAVPAKATEAKSSSGSRTCRSDLQRSSSRSYRNGYSAGEGSPPGLLVEIPLGRQRGCAADLCYFAEARQGISIGKIARAVCFRLTRVFLSYLRDMVFCFFFFLWHVIWLIFWGVFWKVCNSWKFSMSAAVVAVSSISSC